MNKIFQEERDRAHDRLLNSIIDGFPKKSLLAVSFENIDDFVNRGKKFDVLTIWDWEKDFERNDNFLEKAAGLLCDDGVFAASITLGEIDNKYMVGKVKEVLSRHFASESIRFFEFSLWGNDEFIVVAQKNTSVFPQPSTCINNVKRILFTGRANGLMLPGGDMVQLFKTRLALEEMGIAIDISLSVKPCLHFDYDIVHQFGLCHAETPDRFSYLAEKQKKDNVILSTVYRDETEAIEGAKCVEGIFKEEKVGKIEELLQRFSTGKLTVPGLAPFREMNEKLKANRKEWVNKIGYFLPNSHAEMQELRKDFELYRVPYTVVPNAVDTTKYENQSGDLFHKTYGIKDFILCAARIEPKKNQLMLIRAAKILDLPLVLAGSIQDKEYYQLCKKHAPSNILFVEHLSQEMLASGYAAARVHALISWSETVGLSSLEAGLAGCSIVTTDRGGAPEYFGPLAYYCDPGNIQTIVGAIDSAWHNNENENKNLLKQIIKRNFTWDRVAEKTREAYFSFNKLIVEDNRENETLNLFPEYEIDNDIKKVAVFGSSITGEQCVNILIKLGIEVLFFVDNSPIKQGAIINGIPIFSPQIIYERYEEIDAVVLASNGYQDEMRQQLEGQGWRKSVISGSVLLGT